MPIEFKDSIDVDGNILSTGTVLGSNLSGTNTGDQVLSDFPLDTTNLVVVPESNIQDYAEGVDHSLLKARGTGVSTTYVSTVVVGGTTFSQPAVSGEIHSDQGYFDIHYTGATNITVTNLNVASVYVYIDNSGALQQQTSIPTRQDWSRKMFTMRIAIDLSNNTIIGFEYLNNPIGHYANSIRDVYTYLLAQGVPFKKDQVVTGRATDLGFDVSAGSIMEFGGTGDIDNANIITLNAVSNATFFLATRTAFDSGTNTDLPKFWDNNGVITALGSTTLVGHRLYRFSNGNLVMQYGQGNYANMALAKAGVVLEDYVLNPILKNATFFGWWFVESTATNTGGTTLTDFVEYTIGLQGGSSSGLSGALLKGNNLSDLLDVTTARTNLGVKFEDGSDPLDAVYNDGNVGIGTTAPSEKLEVSGNIKATTFVKDGGTASQFLKADGSVDTTSYQSILVSGTNIKTVGGTTILGSGDIPLGVTSIVAGTNITISPPGGTGAVTINSSGGGTTISPNVANQLLTATGGSAIDSEPNLTFDGSTLNALGKIIGGIKTSTATGVITDGITSFKGALDDWGTSYVSGEIMSKCTVGEAVLFGECLFLDDNFQWYKAVNTNLKASRMLGIALNSEGESGELIDVLIKGFVETTHVEDAAANTGTPMYIRSGTPGDMSDTAPTTATQFVRLVGYSYQNSSTNVNGKFILRFDPDNTWIEL